MPTRNVNLTDDQDAFVEKMVKAGGEALDCGDFIEVDDADLDATLDKLASN